MRKLTDADLEKMVDDEFVPDTRSVVKSVRADLKLGQLIPPAVVPVPRTVVLDLHNNTEEQAWEKIMDLAQSGVRRATIITGASGILKIKFQQWTRESLLAPYIYSVAPINNGSFAVQFMKLRPQN